MRLNRSARAAAVTLLLVALFVGWWTIASNYDYSALAGTYMFRQRDMSATLTLRRDGTFHQELRTGSGLQTADGTWHRIGEGGVEFSLGFLRVPGAKKYREEFPDHLDGTSEDDQYFGHFEKVLGIYPILKLNANPPAPRLYRRMF
jgi:hypothetical protein